MSESPWPHTYSPSPWTVGGPLWVTGGQQTCLLHHLSRSVVFHMHSGMDGQITRRLGPRKAEGGSLHSPPGSQFLPENCVWCVVGAQLTLTDVVGFHQKW